MEPLLNVKGLSVKFPIRSRGVIKKKIGEFVAVDDISFSLAPGETLGIVGESGSGKTTLVRAILRAINPSAGTVLFRSSRGVVDLATLSEKSLVPLRREMQMIFQDPFGSLNPRMKVSEILSEPLQIHEPEKRAHHRERILDMLDKVGLDAQAMQKFPHAFSGGQRQRICIARALILNPSLVVCDESVSALDVSVQAQVLNLLQTLQQNSGLTYIFVAHDLNVVSHFCDRALVMYEGKVVESGTIDQIFDDPQHDYTRLLLSAIPSVDPDIRLAPLSRDTLKLD
jgi:ABC-type oligopeptide transport system ATPase subunit